MVLHCKSSFEACPWISKLFGDKGAHYECICHNTTIKMKITRNTNFVEDENVYVEYALFDLLTHDFVNMHVAFN